MGHDLCIALGALGLGWLACSVRLGIISRRDMRRAKAYLDRTRSKCLQAERTVNGSIGHLTLVLSRKVCRRFGRRVDALDRRLIELRLDVEQLQRQAYADWAADGRAALATGLELDEPSTLALRREGSNGHA